MQNQQQNRLTEWHNFGDMNPEIHGGRFIKWQGDYWLLIETRNLEEVGPQGMIRDGEKFMFDIYYIYPDDVWIDGNPDKGLTDPMRDIVESFGKRYSNILEHNEIPPDMDVEYFIVDLPFHIGIDGEDRYSANYWEFLESYGIDESNF